MNTKPTEVEAVPTNPSAVAAPTVSELGELLRLAIDRNVPVETLERLAAMKERFEERDARSQFFDAIAEFQKECPSIRKTSEVKPSADSGMKFSYKYAGLEEIVKTIRPHLAKHGLSFTHDCKANGAGMLDVVCTLQHIAGHSRTANFPAPTSSRAGMSDVQKYASALTFARRQSLIQVLGLSTVDPDNDGADVEPITDAQANVIEEWLSKCAAPSKERAAFLNYLRVGSIGEIPASRFEHALHSIKAVVAKRGAP